MKSCSQRTASSPSGISRSRLPLPSDADHALVQVDLVVLQADELGDAQAGGVEHLEHRAVAVPSGSLTSGADSSDSTSSSDSDFGSERPIFGIAIWAVGSSRITPVADQVAEEAAERGQLAGRRARTGAVDTPGDEAHQLGTGGAATSRSSRASAM
jgi:hypothetical protein